MKRRQIDLSYDLEKRLEEAAQRIREAIVRPAKIKQGILLLRRGRAIIDPVPDDVKEWFDETEEFLDDEET